MSVYIDQLESRLRGMHVYVRMLQDGDPENENPVKILNYIESEIEKALGDRLYAES